MAFYPNITLCDNGCENTGINLTSMSAICKCKFNDIANNELNIINSIIKDESNLAQIKDKNLISKENIENSIKIYRDFQFVDYLVIYNSNYKAFDIYTMIDFILIKRSKSIPDVNYDFIDFIISEELDHALVLCKAKDKKNIYKIFMLKDSECKDIWK